MQGKIAAFFAGALGKLVLVALVIGLVLFGVSQCNSARQANTRAELGEGQAEAAGENAADAVDTAGAVAAAHGEADSLTRENADAINNAEGAAAPVNPAARDAGLDSLCRRASYRDVADCVQRAGAGSDEGADAARSPPDG